MSALDWENPEPRDHRYWIAIRDALASRRIACDIPLWTDTPLLARVPGNIIAALAGAAPSWSAKAVVGDPGEPDAVGWRVLNTDHLAETPRVGTHIDDNSYLVDFLKKCYTTIKRFRYHLLPVQYFMEFGINYDPWSGTGHWRVAPDWPPYNPANTWNAMRYCADEGMSYTSYAYISGANSFEMVYVTNDAGIGVCGGPYLFNSPGRIYVINPIPVGGPVTLVADRHQRYAEYFDEPGFKGSLYDSMGTGLVRGVNTLECPPSAPFDIAPTVAEWRHMDHALFDSDTAQYGFSIAQFATIDYGDDFILQPVAPEVP